MFKTPQQLNSEIDQNITSNGTEDITGPVLNAVLKSMVGSLNGNSFSMPKDASVTSGDIGKLLMNDGSGTAKVYQYAAAVNEQLGEWKIAITALGDTFDNTSITIESFDDDNDIHFTRLDWRDGNTPANALEELEMIQDYIDNHPNAENLSTSIVNDELIISEDSYEGVQIFVINSDVEILTVVSRSLPPLPAAPTSFPLGKLIAIEGENAIISSAQVETYNLDGTLEIEHDIFNMAMNFDLAEPEDVIAILEQIIIPAPDGKVKTLSIEDFQMNRRVFDSYRHFFIGLPIAATSNTVTVLNLRNFFHLTNYIVKLFKSPFFSQFDDND